MTKIRAFIGVSLFFGIIAISKLGIASQVTKGSYSTAMFSSGTVVLGQNALMGVQCSTAGAAAQNLNTLFIQFFDTAPVGQTGVNFPGGINMTSVSTGDIVTPQIVVTSSNTTGAGGNMFLGADWSSFGGLHVNSGLYFYMSPATLGFSCTPIWRRDNE